MVNGMSCNALQCFDNFSGGMSFDEFVFPHFAMFAML